VTEFPSPDAELTHILVVEDVERSQRWYTAEFLAPPVVNGAETRAFFRDPDGHLFEISEYAVG
jgi:catechol 2,3-dioxygenase-like lactoylglutathione lyase family enzyme